MAKNKEALQLSQAEREMCVEGLKGLVKDVDRVYSSEVNMGIADAADLTLKHKNKIEDLINKLLGQKKLIE